LLEECRGLRVELLRSSDVIRRGGCN